MPSLRLIHSEALAGLSPTLAHAVTTRDGGVSPPPFDSLNLGRGTDDDPERVAENRSRVATALGFESLTTPYQEHGRTVVEMDAPTDERPRCDALVVSTPGVLVGVLGADCPGVLIVDEGSRKLAVVHAGWRGVAAGVLHAALDRLPSPTRAWIGPGIGIDKYEVGADVADAIRAALPAHVDPIAEGVIRPGRTGHAYVSLGEALRLQLETRITPESIDRVRLCTHAERASFFSYRRDGARTGRHALVAGWTA